MPKVFIISESDGLAASLGRYFKYVRGLETVCVPFPAVDSASDEGQQWPIQTFHHLADILERKGIEGDGIRGLRNSIVILDLWDDRLPSLGDLNPIDTKRGSWAAVVAMLVLAFPEVHWVLNTQYQPFESFLFREAHTLAVAGANENRANLRPLLRLIDKGFKPLFDPTRLRNYVRENIQLTTEQVQEGDRAVDKKVASYVPTRPLAAAALDEEEAYAYFNAYVAYRFGYRSHVVTTYGMMSEVFSPGGDGRDKQDTVSLVFEDLYLNYPDERPGSDLRKRDTNLGRLKDVSNRVFVTVGHHRTNLDQDTWGENLRYLDELGERDGFNWKTVFKPESGIFDVWRRSGMRRLLAGNGGKAPGFNWPPRQAVGVETTGSHSAPGRLLVIADRLIRRAEPILRNSNSVPDVIHGATLALDAEEYLGHRTPTTSLEAISQKHQLEVLAECMFYGVEYNVDIRSRFEEIEQETRSVGGWFRPRTRKQSTLNAEIRILSELVLTYRNYNQFDEEQACLARLRNTYRHLWFERRRLWAWLFYPARWYVDFLLVSLLRFGLAIGFWILLIGTLFNLLMNPTAGIENDPLPDELWHGYVDSMVAFFGLQPPHELRELYPGLAMWVCMAAIILGFVHLGIFISHLYSMMARR